MSDNAREAGLEAPAWMTSDDARLNLEGDLLGIVVGYGGQRIVAGPTMESMVSELVDYVLSERSAAFRERALDADPQPTPEENHQ